MIIGIAGAGGIGSNVARHLVQSGVMDFLILDFDRVEVSNLNRQFYRADQIGRSKVGCLKENLIAINPGVRIQTLEQRLSPGQGKEIFKDCDLVVEGLDDPLAKKALVEDMGVLNLPLVGASGIAGRDMDGIVSRKIGHCTIVGDFTSDVKENELFPPKIAVIAGLMAGHVLDIIQRSKR